MSGSTALALKGRLPAWDLELRRVEIDAVVRWTLAQLRVHGVSIDELEALSIPGEVARDLGRRLTDAALSPELRRPLHAALRRALPEVPWESVWIQSYAHFRILMPGDAVAAVPPHTDYGLGHSLAERNLWLPLTDATGSGALHVLDLGASLRWLARQPSPLGILAESPVLPAVPARRGQVLLFTPLNIHRARPPEQPRVSIDLRIVPSCDPSTPRDSVFSPSLSPA